MSHLDFKTAKTLTGKNSFKVLLMAAIRLADTSDQQKLQKAFPEVFAELIARTNSLDGRLPNDTD